MNLSFHNSRSLYQKVDKLPTGPQWTCELVTITGDLVNDNGTVTKEVVELWHRDPVECVRELIGKQEFDGHIAYRPERVFVDERGRERKYDEMWTAEKWWELQVRTCGSCWQSKHNNLRLHHQ